MGTPRRTSRVPRAYTLVELLVVISIIAVLAGLALPVSGKVIEMARVAKARSEIKDILTALKGYEMEYGSVPLPAADQGANIGWEPLGPGSERGGEILRALCGIRGGTVRNPKELEFLEGRIVTVPRGGLLLDPDSGEPEGFYDPWGNPYFLMVDSDYDGRVDPAGNNDDAATAVMASVIVASAGPGVDAGEADGDNLLAIGRKPIRSWQK